MVDGCGTEPFHARLRTARGQIEEVAMTGSELYVQASLWKHCRVRERRDHDRVSRAVVAHLDRVHTGHGWRTRRRWARDADLAVLVMEGAAVDRSNNGTLAEDALFRALLARGLMLATDLDHLDLRPVPVWRVVVDPSGAVTIDWPHEHPLLREARVELPVGWLEAAVDLGVVVVLAGYGLSLRAPVIDPLAPRLVRAAEVGALVAGAVVTTVASRAPVPAPRLGNGEVPALDHGKQQHTTRTSMQVSG
jgi:hypothetical protein